MITERKLAISQCERIAKKILDDHKVKNQALLDKLTADIIQRDAVPVVRLYWNSKQEKLDYEVITP